MSIIEELAEQHARMTELAFVEGNRERAASIVDQFFEAVKENEATLDSGISAILPQRYVEALDVHDIVKIRHLTGLRSTDILAADKLGPKALEAVRQALRRHGWRLRGEQ